MTVTDSPSYPTTVSDCVLKMNKLSDVKHTLFDEEKALLDFFFVIHLENPTILKDIKLSNETWY